MAKRYDIIRGERHVHTWVRSVHERPARAGFIVRETCADCRAETTAHPQAWDRAIARHLAGFGSEVVS